jgi:hypothetical protein
VSPYFFSTKGEERREREREEEEEEAQQKGAKNLLSSV